MKFQDNWRTWPQAERDSVFELSTEELISGEMAAASHHEDELQGLRREIDRLTGIVARLLEVAVPTERDRLQVIAPCRYMKVE